MSLIGRLLYGMGMQMMEAIRLRVKDVDFDRQQVIVREGKGSKDQVVILPETLERRCGSIWNGCGFFSMRIARGGGAICMTMWWARRWGWWGGYPDGARSTGA